MSEADQGRLPPAAGFADTAPSAERYATLLDEPDGSSAGRGTASKPSLKADANFRAPSAAISSILADAADGNATPPKWSKRRILLALALVFGIGTAVYHGQYWWTEGRYLVSTDDAYVKADLSVISAKVPGYVTEVLVAENSSVKAGDSLAQIDDRDYKIAVDSARNKVATQDATVERLKQQALAQGATIEQAKAQVLSAKAASLRAGADFQRAQTLAQREFGSIKTLDQARADRDQMQASVQAAEADQLAAEANLAVLNAQVKEAQSVRAELQSSLEKAQLDLSFATIKAPFGGVVGNRAVQPGQYAQTGTRLLSLVPLDSVYIEANYKETQLDRIRPGQPVDVAVDAAGGRVYHGIVESIAPASGSQYSLLPPENATGNFTKIVQRVPVRIRISGEAVRERVLRPGLSVATYVNTKSLENRDKAVEGASLGSLQASAKSAH